MNQGTDATTTFTNLVPGCELRSALCGALQDQPLVAGLTRQFAHESSLAENPATLCVSQYPFVFPEFAPLSPEEWAEFKDEGPFIRSRRQLFKTVSLEVLHGNNRRADALFGLLYGDYNGSARMHLVEPNYGQRTTVTDKRESRVLTYDKKLVQIGDVLTWAFYSQPCSRTRLCQGCDLFVTSHNAQSATNTKLCDFFVSTHLFDPLPNTVSCVIATRPGMRTIAAKGEKAGREHVARFADTPQSVLDLFQI